MVEYTYIKGVKIPLCIRCGKPVRKPSEIKEDYHSPSKITCRKC